MQALNTLESGNTDEQPTAPVDFSPNDDKETTMEEQVCTGPARPVRQVRFWPYHFLVALRLVGVGYTVGGGGSGTN